MTEPDTPFTTPNSNLANTSEMLPCIACGHSTHITAPACPKCGATQRKRSYKSKKVAALFAFFLGGFGAHRFYLGQWWGIFYLLLFWAWIPGLIALGEFIYFLMCDTQKWDEKYNEGRPAGTGEGGGAAVVILVILGAFVMVAVLGIIAAVALPAYQDYTIRAKTSQALVEMTPIKTKVAAFYLEHKTAPDSNIMLGVEEPYIVESGHQISVSKTNIELRFSATDVNALNGKTILLNYYAENGELIWHCSGGSVENRFLPSSCRNNR